MVDTVYRDEEPPVLTRHSDLRRHQLNVGARTAVAGIAVWILAVVALSLELAEALLLVGPLIAIPLGLPLCVPRGRHDPLAARWRRVALLELPAALSLVGSFAFEPGSIAGALTTPWVAFTICTAILGALRLGERGPSPTSELGVDCALLFLPIGGAWLLASRLGWPFLGFEEPVVFLTAAHFHFAGFALPLLAGRAARKVGGPLASAMTVGVITGVPLVAIGISLTLHGIRIIELLSALWLCSACLALAALQFHLALREKTGFTSLLLTASAMSILVGMGLAGAYALGVFVDTRWLEIPDMLRLHAPLNIFGFTLPGLIHWHRHDRATKTDDGLPAGIAIHVPLLDGPVLPDRGAWETRGFSPSAENGPRPTDARDEHIEVIASVESLEAIADAISRFDIFPPSTLEGETGSDTIAVGDTILSRYHALPGIDLIFACRVTESHHDRDESVGFTCRTLEGHPFTGEETFRVEPRADPETLHVVCRSWSRPESFFARLLRHAARRRQLEAARSAVVRLATHGARARTNGPPRSRRRGSITPDQP